MDKKLFLLIFLTSCFAVAQAQQSNGVTVSNFKASSTNLVEFTVSWDWATMPALWSDSVWVFVDYRDFTDPNNMMRLPLDVANATVTFEEGTGTKSTVPGNTGGFYVIGDARTTRGKVVANVSVQANFQSPSILGACAYAINYPPLAKYKDGLTQITFTGSPLFILTLNDGNAEKVVRVGKSFMIPPGYTLTSFTDTTGAPGRIVYPSAEAFEPDSNAPVGTTWTIIDSRDNKEYKVRKMADGRIWMIQDLKYGGPDGNACDKTYFMGTASAAPTNRFGTGTYGDCRNNNEPNAGYLYDWSAAMQHPDAYEFGSYPGINGTEANTAWVRGICPEGFHVPTHAEFADAYDKFQSAYECANDDCWNSGSAWQGVLGGSCSSSGNPNESPIISASYWSSTSSGGAQTAYTLRFFPNTNTVDQPLLYRVNGRSVRCVKDPAPPPSETFVPDANAPVGSVWTITDSRDNKKYKVRKMEDNRIWMTQDLRYGGPDGNACEKSSFNGSTSENVNSNRFGEGTFGDCRNNTVANAGYLYDWAAAVQHPDAYYGSTTYRGVDGTGISTAWVRGICPEGFHIPTYAEFDDAMNKFPGSKGAKWNASAWQGVLGGMCNNTGVLSGQNGHGGYWSSLQYNSSNVIRLVFYDDDENLGNTIKNAGYSVRCVKDPAPPSSDTFTPDASAPEGSVWTITDSRDSKTYKLRKMEDGHIWMIQDLRYGGTGTDICATREEFTDGTNESAIATDFFGTGTFGDCMNARNNNTPADRGYLYNWAAAVQDAGAYPGGSYTGCTGNGSACKGLCPVNFHVPTKDEFFGANGDFLGSSDGRWNASSKWQGVLGGWCNNAGALSNQGNSAYYWSSTQAGTNTAYGLLFESGNVNSQYGDFKYYGYSLRCILDYN